MCLPIFTGLCSANIKYCKFFTCCGSVAYPLWYTPFRIVAIPYGVTVSLLFSILAGVGEVFIYYMVYMFRKLEKIIVRILTCQNTFTF